MTINKNVKFQYFKVEIAQKEGINFKSKKFVFSDWVTYIRKVKLEKEIKNLRRCKARIDGIKYDKKNKIWILRFMRAREDSIPSKFRDKVESEPIDLDKDEYIGEDVTLIYDEDTSVMMLQNNRFSLNSSDIEEYFNTYNQYESVAIVIRPILNTVDKDFFNKNNTKTISISFANLFDEPTNFCSPLGAIMKSYYEMGGISGSINIGVGRTKEIVSIPSKTAGKTKKVKKERYLYSNKVLDVFEDIVNNRDLIESGRLKIKNEDESTVDTVDLFDNIFHEFITFCLETREVLTIEKISNSMISIYLSKKDKIIKCIK